jgi:EAL domain-containing protein (putative c-di-GMP-specific phosphodiesterase class I)
MSIRQGGSLDAGEEVGRLGDRASAALDRVLLDLIDPMVLMRRVVEEAVALVEAGDGAVVEIRDREDLVYVCGAGSLADHVGTRVFEGSSLSGLAVRTGETMYSEDCRRDPRVDSEAVRRVGAGSMVCVPLRGGNGLIGVLKVVARAPHAFSADDVGLLARLADFISAALGSVTDVHRAALALLGAARSSEAAGARGRPRRGDRLGAALGRFIGNVLQPGVMSDNVVVRRIEQVLAERSIEFVYQPIIELEGWRLIGVEALARFPGPPEQPPNAWFDEAHRVGLGVELQLVAVERALSVSDRVPDDMFVSINVGPDALQAPQLAGLVEGVARGRLVIELTEEHRIDDYARLRSELEGVRARGVRLAIDDLGAGFASLSHVVGLSPELIKLDRRFTRGIDQDPARRAVAQALVSLGRDVGARVIAEGIETEGECAMVRELGIGCGQGYFIGRPADLRKMRDRLSAPPHSGRRRRHG